MDSSIDKGHCFDDRGLIYQGSFERRGTKRDLHRHKNALWSETWSMHKIDTGAYALHPQYMCKQRSGQSICFNKLQVWQTSNKKRSFQLICGVISGLAGQRQSWIQTPGGKLPHDWPVLSPLELQSHEVTLCICVTASSPGLVRAHPGPWQSREPA
ncbi:hypothetical protein TrVGV298_007528 [Trichoderma virens]|nr:hypothetical protein TrVGV298_007528 [Trichoderma virens]